MQNAARISVVTVEPTTGRGPRVAGAGKLGHNVELGLLQKAAASPMHHSEIAPVDVHRTLGKHLLVDGYPIVVDLAHSRRSWVRDSITGKDYLDFFSFFASNPIGFNHPSM